MESWYVAPDISGAETIAISAPAGAEFHYFCYLAQKYSIGKNVYLTTATPRKVPRSSDNHDNAVLQCTLTSRYHNEARELMYRSPSSLSSHSSLNLKRCGVYGGRDGRVWEMGAEKCGEGVGKCVGEMGRVEKCGVGVEKCVGVWVRGDVGKCGERCRELLG